MESVETITVQLTCTRNGKNFGHDLPRSVDWLAQHWKGRFAVRCPICGDDHAYETREVVLVAALAEPDLRRLITPPI